MNLSLPASLVPQGQEVVYHLTAPDGTVSTPPALIQREVNVKSIQSNPCNDNEVFSKVITYQYGTRTDPRLQPVVDTVADVLNTLYTRIDRLEESNVALQTELTIVQKALVVERRRNARREDYNFRPQYY